MKIEAGKKYVQRDHFVVGPFFENERTGLWYLKGRDSLYEAWYPSGAWCYAPQQDHRDLIYEHVELRIPEEIWINEFSHTAARQRDVYRTFKAANEHTFEEGFIGTHKYVRAT